jgi:hypothetical protein
VVAHDIEIHHEARTARTSGGEEIEDTLGGHRFLHLRSRASTVVRADPSDRDRTWSNKGGT